MSEYTPKKFRTAEEEKIRRAEYRQSERGKATTAKYNNRYVPKSCVVQWCTNARKIKLLCRKHHFSLLVYGPLPLPSKHVSRCIVSWCETRKRVGNLCQAHETAKLQGLDIEQPWPTVETKKLISADKRQQWLADNALAIKQWNKVYHSTPEQRKKRAAYAKTYKLPPKVRQNKTRFENERRARILGNEWESFTIDTLIDLYGVDCHICGMQINMRAGRQSGMKDWQVGFQIDHVIPISKGGPHTLKNCRPSHGLCNLKKHAR